MQAYQILECKALRDRGSAAERRVRRSTILAADAKFKQAVDSTIWRLCDRRVGG
jgi:hypothetical protein